MLDGFFGMTKAIKNGHEIQNFECQDFQVWFTENSGKIISKVGLYFSGNRDQMGQEWH